MTGVQTCALPISAEEPISTALAIDHLKVELGYGLLPLINDTKGHRITDQIKSLRRQLATEMGFVMPSVRIIDNMQLGSNEYAIRVKELPAGKGELQPGQLLVMHQADRLARDAAAAPRMVGVGVHTPVRQHDVERVHTQALQQFSQAAGLQQQFNIVA